MQNRINLALQALKSEHNGAIVSVSVTLEVTRMKAPRGLHSMFNRPVALQQTREYDLKRTRHKLD